MSKYSKKTKSNFDDILDGLEDDDDFEEIIPGRRKKESRWAKVGKIIVGTALVGALGALGFYGLKQYDEVKYENLMNTLKEYGVKTKDLLKIGKAAEADNNEKAPDIQESLNTTPMESKKPDSKSDTVENPFNKGEMVPKNTKEPKTESTNDDKTLFEEAKNPTPKEPPKEDSELMPTNEDVLYGPENKPVDWHDEQAPLPTNDNKQKDETKNNINISDDPLETNNNFFNTERPIYKIIADRKHRDNPAYEYLDSKDDQQYRLGKITKEKLESKKKERNQMAPIIEEQLDKVMSENQKTQLYNLNIKLADLIDYMDYNKNGELYKSDIYSRAKKLYLRVFNFNMNNLLNGNSDTQAAVNEIRNEINYICDRGLELAKGYQRATEKVKDLKVAVDKIMSWLFEVIESIQEQNDDYLLNTKTPLRQITNRKKNRDLSAYEYALSDADKQVSKGKISNEEATKKKKEIEKFAPNIDKQMSELLWKSEIGQLYSLTLRLYEMIDLMENRLKDNLYQSDLYLKCKKLYSTFYNFNLNNLLYGYKDKDDTINGIKSDIDYIVNKGQKIDKTLDKYIKDFKQLSDDVLKWLGKRIQSAIDQYNGTKHKLKENIPWLPFPENKYNAPNLVNPNKENQFIPNHQDTYGAFNYEAALGKLNSVKSDLYNMGNISKNSNFTKTLINNIGKVYTAIMKFDISNNEWFQECKKYITSMYELYDMFKERVELSNNANGKRLAEQFKNNIEELKTEIYKSKFGTDNNNYNEKYAPIYDDDIPAGTAIGVIKVCIEMLSNIVNSDIYEKLDKRTQNLLPELANYLSEFSKVALIKNYRSAEDAYMDVRQKINDIANGLEEYSKRNRKLKIRIMDYVHYFRGASKQIAEIVRWAITYKNGNTKDYWYSAGMGAPWSYRSVNKELDEKFKSNIKNAN